MYRESSALAARPAPRRRGLLPALLLAALTCLAAPRASAQNYLHTQGAKIVDSSGSVVRLTGLNWFGLETSTYCPHGLWVRPMGSILDQVKSLGYNCLRVPYCNQLFDAGSTPNGIDFSQNPDLQGLTGLQILDKLVAGAKARGLKIILDRHRPDSGSQSALWYTSAYSEQRWISDWTMLAARYQGNDTVIGCDLHNEPHDPATWGSGDTSTDWRLAAQRCGNAIQAVNPHLLIIVEGIQSVNEDYYWWGGNLEAAGSAPVQLSTPNQLVYSTHDYPSSVYGQPWFYDASYPSNLTSVWSKHWGYLAENNIAPVYVGEFGTFDQTTSDAQWFQRMAGYISTNNLSFTFWCLNPDSGDTGGILQDDWMTVNQNKQSVLQPLLATLIGSGSAPPTPAPPSPPPAPIVPAAPSGVSATAGDGTAQIQWTAPSGTVTSYNLYRATASGAEGGSPYKTGLTGTSVSDTGLSDGTTYYYTVPAVNSAGVSHQSAEVSAKPSAPVTGGGGGGTSGTVTAASKIASGFGPYYGEEDVVVSSTAPLTALSVTVTLQKTTGVSYNGQYNTVGGQITSSHADTGKTLTYQFVLASGQTLAAAANQTYAAQFNGTGTIHPTAGDVYTVTATAGGKTTTLTGHF